MSVAWYLGPQVLDRPLRSSEATVDLQGVGVGTDLRRDPGGQTHKEGVCQGFSYAQDPLQTRKRKLHLLPLLAAFLLGALGYQKHPGFEQFLLQFPAAVGQVPEEPARKALPEIRFFEQLSAQACLGDVGGGKLVERATRLVAHNSCSLIA